MVSASSALQRCLRDVHAVTQHVVVASQTYEMIGKVLLGVEPDEVMLYGTWLPFLPVVGHR